MSCTITHVPKEVKQRHELSRLFSYVLLTAITPGPNNIMSMTNAGKYGFQKAFLFNVGVLLGFLVVMSACAAFSSLLYGTIPAVKPYMLCLGAAYILWLAWTVWRDKPHGQGGTMARTNTLLSGMVLQFINVKVILYGITVLSSFVLPHCQSAAAVAGFVVFLSLVGLGCTCCWALFGAVFEGFFQRHWRLLNGIMALLLVYCAGSMLLEPL